MFAGLDTVEAIALLMAVSERVSGGDARANPEGGILPVLIDGAPALEIHVVDGARVKAFLSEVLPGKAASLFPEKVTQ